MRLIKLPPWNLTNDLPAFHDVESASAVQMTAKLYEYMKAFQVDYEKFVCEINKAITQYNTDINTDQECFEKAITKTVHDYLHIIDTKLAHQDREIEEAILFIKENLEAGITNILEQMKESGELDTVVTEAFDELGTRVSELELDFTEITTNISNNSQSIYENENRIISLEEKTTTLEDKTTVLEERVDTAETDIDSLETRVTTNEDQLSNVYNKSEVNFLTKYLKYGGTLDPNTTSEPLILTDHANTPTQGVFWVIRSYIYSTNNNKKQIAMGFQINQMYQRYLDGDVWSNWEPIDNELVYTNQEFATNEYIDGKRVYRKRFNIEGLPNTKELKIELGYDIDSINIMRIQGTAYTQDKSYYICLPYPFPGEEIIIGCYDKYLSIISKFDASTYNAYVDLYYTKN